MEFITAGNTQFKVSNFKTWTKEQFISQYKGLVNCDLSSVWNEIAKLNEDTESNNETRKESKKPKREKGNDVPFPKRGL